MPETKKGTAPTGRDTVGAYRLRIAKRAFWYSAAASAASATCAATAAGAIEAVTATCAVEAVATAKTVAA
ncbi:hypothetical protein ABEW50_01115 [Paenibacillus jamilae]